MMVYIGHIFQVPVRCQSKASTDSIENTTHLTMMSQDTVPYRVQAS